MYIQDTIAAIATPPGQGGVGIIRISGSQIIIDNIIQTILHTSLSPRKATYLPFYDLKNQIIDFGIAIYFSGPNSLTGEFILELQGHGGPVVLDLLLQEILRLKVRLAQPGEFSQRAFLNDKIDLNQAEAIADLIASASVQAARAAIRSFQGGFSKEIDNIVDNLTYLRVWVEASLDFPDEEIEIIPVAKIQDDLQVIKQQLIHLQQQAQQGLLLQEGMYLVIAGLPNAGKSSLLNALAEQDIAIVTDIAGTTRDILREKIVIDGLPIHIIDTAGLRESQDPVEQEGIKRAWKEIKRADRILWIIDDTLPQDKQHQLPNALPEDIPITKVYNKVDLSQGQMGWRSKQEPVSLGISILQNQGLDILRQHLKDCVGFYPQEGSFLARRRHLDILSQSLIYFNNTEVLLENSIPPIELIAEELYKAQNKLGEITGKVTSDDLLGHIFSSFCIGK